MDIRRYSEFSGEKGDCYTFFTKAGHIPRAVWPGNWDQLVDEEQNFIKDIDEVWAHWERLGVKPDEGPLVFYCGTGWRSCIGFFIAHLLGLESKNYDDSFYGWFNKGNQIDEVENRS